MSKLGDDAENGSEFPRPRLPDLVEFDGQSDEEDEQISHGQIDQVIIGG